MPIKDLLPSIWRRDVSPTRREEEQPFYSLQNEMNRLFNDFFRGFEMAPLDYSSERLSSFSPSIDIREDEKEINIRAELPGMDEKDIEVSLTENALNIKGEKKEEKEDKGKNYYRIERSYGSFNRVIALPQGLDMDNAKASFKNGVLSVNLSKSEDAKKKVKKIEIKKE